MKMTKINDGQSGAGGNYENPYRALTPSASPIRWQTTEAPFLVEFKISRPPATRAAAAACTQQ
jgi:hypothetical protein